MYEMFLSQGLRDRIFEGASYISKILNINRACRSVSLKVKGELQPLAPLTTKKKT